MVNYSVIKLGQLADIRISRILKKNTDCFGGVGIKIRLF